MPFNLQFFFREKLPKSTVVPLFDPVIFVLVDKLADGNARIRDGAKKGTEILAAANSVGPAAVGAHAMRALPAKYKTAWRPIASRLQLLTDLVVNHGVGPSSGLNADSLLHFPKSTNAYAHSNGEVRDAAKDLVVAIQRNVGTAAVDSYLKLLRPKQLEEYQAAFEGGKGGSKKEPPRTDKQLQHPTHSPGGKVHTTAEKVANKNVSHPATANTIVEDDEEKQDFTTCMFCGVSDRKWTENDLDVHYWKDCPLLISCPSCAQIVEIAGLPEHLLDECDAKDQYVPCDVTGMFNRFAST